MKFLISLYKIKNMAEPAVVLGQLDQIDHRGLIAGIEVNADLDCPVEVKRLFEYGHLLKSRHKTLQIHSPHGFSKLYNETSKLDKYLSIYNRLAEELGQTLSITIHPVESVKKEKARYLTLKLITRLVSICELQNYKLTFTLENLNLIRSRLDTEGIRPIVLGSDVDFCWDIGHEVYENNCTYSIDPYLRNKLSNVHIHDINGSDHYPFHYGRTDYSRAISFLTQTGYQGALVVEINTDYLTGESWAEKYTDYVHQVYTLADVYESLMETQEKAI